MASFRAIPGTITALRRHLEGRLSTDLEGVVESPTVVVLGETSLRDGPDSNAIGIYLHRISVDENGRNRYLRPLAPGERPQPELPVNLHMLLVAWTATASNEAPLIAYAMQRIGSAFDIDARRMDGLDPAWRYDDRAQVVPEEMSHENLLRIWEALPGDYRLSSPFLLRTIRLEPVERLTVGPPVTTTAVGLETT